MSLTASNLVHLSCLKIKTRLFLDQQLTLYRKLMWLKNQQVSKLFRVPRFLWEYFEKRRVVIQQKLVSIHCLLECNTRWKCSISFNRNLTTPCHIVNNDRDKVHSSGQTKNCAVSDERHIAQPSLLWASRYGRTNILVARGPEERTLSLSVFMRTEYGTLVTMSWIGFVYASDTLFHLRFQNNDKTTISYVLEIKASMLFNIETAPSFL